MLTVEDVAFLRDTGRVKVTSPIRFVHKSDGVHMFVNQTHLRFTDDQWRDIVDAMCSVEKPSKLTEVPGDVLFET